MERHTAYSKTTTVFIPKGSNVVPFWVCYGFWVRDYNILPKKELHRRVWVEPNVGFHVGLGMVSCRANSTGETEADQSILPGAKEASLLQGPPESIGSRRGLGGS